MPDLEIIKKHLISFNEDLKNLEKYRNVTSEELHDNTDLLWILERGIYLLIQNLFDMFAHIISADFNEKWDYYSDISEVLFKKNIIDSSQKDLLQQMAGFRNRLSHEYLGLDTEILLNIVNNKLPDLRSFLLIIKEYCRL